MGFYSFVLLSAAVVLACINSSSKATAAAFPVQETTERPNRRSTTRFPRTSDSTGEDDEARQSLSNEVKSAVHKLKTQLEAWIWVPSSEANDKAILKKLHIGDDVKSNLRDPNVKLPKEVLKRHPEPSIENIESQKLLLKDLLGRHGENEVAVARTLYADSQSENKITKKAASMLLELQYQKWLKDEDTVYKIVVEMGKWRSPDVSKIFADFIQFSAHVKDSRAALIVGLVKVFGGTRNFLESLLNPTTRHQTSDAVMDLENVVLATWKNHHLSPEDVVTNELGLNTADDLLSPAMTTFLKYVDLFNQENKQKPYLLTKLAQDQGARPVIKALIKADESGEKGYVRQFIYNEGKRLTAKLETLNENGVLSLQEMAPFVSLYLHQAFQDKNEFFLVIAKAMTKWRNNGRPTSKDDLLIVEEMSWLDDVLDAGFKNSHPGAKWEDVEKNFRVGVADKPYMEWIRQKYASWLERTKGNSDVSLRRV